MHNSIITVINVFIDISISRIGIVMVADIGKM